MMDNKEKDDEYIQAISNYKPDIKTLEIYTSGIRMVERIITILDEEGYFVSASTNVDKFGVRYTPQERNDKEDDYLFSCVITDDNSLLYTLADAIYKEASSYIDLMIDDLFLFGVKTVLLHDGSTVPVIQYFNDKKGGKNA